MEDSIQISVSGLGKKYGSNRLFKDLNLSFNQANNYAITGFNGSGKSTLLLTLAGFITPTEGKVIWTKNNSLINNLPDHFSFSSPSLNLFEDLTLEEHLYYHKNFVKTFNINQAKTDLEIFGLNKFLSKQILTFSSGMKQRLKLILALNNDVPVLFLDEPCSNLDEQGILIYKEIIQKKQENNLVIIATNQASVEFPLVGETINLEKN